MEKTTLLVEIEHNGKWISDRKPKDVVEDQLVNKMSDDSCISFAQNSDEPELYVTVREVRD